MDCIAKNLDFKTIEIVCERHPVRVYTSRRHHRNQISVMAEIMIAWNEILTHITLVVSLGLYRHVWLFCEKQKQNWPYIEGKNNVVLTYVKFILPLLKKTPFF